MLQYLKLLRDFRDAVRAGDWKKAWAVAIEIQKAVLEMFTGGAVVAMSAEESTEYAALTEEIRGLLDTTVVPADVAATKWGDGVIIDLLKEIFKTLLPILIGR